MSKFLGGFVSIGVVTVMFAVTVLDANAWWGRSCRVTDAVWRAQHTATKGILIERTTHLGITVSNERNVTAERLLAAIQVFTKQTSADGQKEQLMLQASSKAFTSTVTQQHRRERLAEIKEQFGPDTGNGVQACQTVTAFSGVMRSIDGIVQEANRNVNDIDIAPGKVTSLSSAIALRLDKSSTDASVLLDTSASKSNKQKVISQLAGMPVPKPSATVLNTSVGDVMLLRARRVEALRSPALVSLSAVAAMSSGGGHTGGGGADSVLEQMDFLIDQYGGGPKYQQWSAGVSTQSERGLIIELTRLRALHLRLKQVSNDQDARLASVFATMVAAKVGGDL